MEHLCVDLICMLGTAMLVPGFALSLHMHMGYVGL